MNQRALAAGALTMLLGATALAAATSTPAPTGPVGSEDVIAEAVANCQLLLPGWTWWRVGPIDAQALLRQPHPAPQGRAFLWFTHADKRLALCEFATYGGCEDRVEYFHPEAAHWVWETDATLETVCLSH